MKIMEEASHLSRPLPGLSRWTYDEALRLCHAVMRGAVAPTAAQQAVPRQPVGSVRTFIARMHRIVAAVVRPCGVCIACDEDFPAVLMAWFEACVEAGWPPLNAPQGAALDGLRDVMAAAVVSYRGCRDRGVLAPRADKAYEAARAMMIARLATGPAAPRLTAREFLDGLLTLPREDREALAAQLLAAP